MSAAEPVGTHERLTHYYEQNGCSRRTPRQNRRAWHKSRRMAGRACPDCKGTGLIDIDECNCAVGPSGYYGMHERYCGTDACPNGCWDLLHAEVPRG